MTVPASIVAHLGTAIVQSIPSDNQVIMDHSCDAHQILEAILMRALSKTNLNHTASKTNATDPSLIYVQIISARSWSQNTSI